jgi:hypothetical protein
VAAGGLESNGQAGLPADGASGSSSTPRPGPTRFGASPGAPFDRTDGHPPAAGAGLGDGPEDGRADGEEGDDAANTPGGDSSRPERAVREHGGAEDFRAVAPPVMSFAQGRRR